MREVRQLRVTDSPVAGRLAVLVTSTCCAVSAIAQLFGHDASGLITHRGSGVDTAWSIDLILAAVLTWTGRLWRVPIETEALEVGGIALMVVPLAYYDWLIWTMPDTAGIVQAVLTAAAVNATGRGVLLARRARQMARVRRLYPPDPPTPPGG